MQFREQAKKVQCIRSVYSPEKKRCEQKLIATFPRWSITCPQLPDLTEAENAELKAWFEARSSQQQASENKYLASSAGRQFIKIAEAIALNGSSYSANQVNEIWEGMTAIRRAMKKAGHVKSRTAKIKKAGD